jgi:hypothetical protein
MKIQISNWTLTMYAAVEIDLNWKFRAAELLIRSSTNNLHTYFS